MPENADRSLSVLINALTGEVEIGLDPIVR